MNDLPTEIAQREKKASNKRRYARFDHHSGTMLELKVKDSKGEWAKTYAFITDESFGGLGLLAVTSTSLKTNQVCLVNVLGIGWIEGKIVWCKSLDDSMQEIGIRYSRV